MRFAVLDLETTGNSSTDDIIQVGVVIVSEQLEIIQTYSSFCKPSKGIPPFITQLTGIDESMVEDAPDLEDVLLELIPLLNDSVLVAHNVHFDLGFLNKSLEKCGYLPFTGRNLDTIELLKVLYPSIPTYQLGAVSELFGVQHDTHHQADSDALATAHILIHALTKLQNLPLLTVQRLTLLLQGIPDLGWIFYHYELQMQEQELQISDEYDYFNQFSLKAKEWGSIEPARQNAEPNEDWERLTFEEYLAYVRSQFEQLFDNYEVREAQDTMFHEVHDALDHEKHLLIEAGTGTGKSLGYLLPALYYGIRNEQKMVVSTHTINLQEQLRSRDLPLLHQVLPVEFRAAVFKGRGNYLCLRKFEGKVNHAAAPATQDELITSAQMVVWLTETETGDQEEVNFSYRGADYWVNVASDADSCLNRSCPWFKRCYYHRARHEAQTADITITNHSLLFTDIQADHRLLPAYNHLIIDEAHHLEDVAGKHLGMQVHYLTLIQLIARLARDSKHGQLPALRTKLMQEDDEYIQSWLEIIDDIVPNLQIAKEHWDSIFDNLYQLAAEGGEAAIEQSQLVVRLKTDKLPKDWEKITAAEIDSYAVFTQIIKELDRMLTQIKERIDDYAVQAIVTDLNGMTRDLSSMRDGLKSFVRMERPEHVYWLEASTQYRMRSVQLFAVPIDVSEPLQKHLFDAKSSVIMTSATLTVQKSFAFAAAQIGLSGYEESGKLKTVQLESPFRYREQALVIVPRDFPVLKGTRLPDNYLETLADSLAEVAAETGGRMLVLFTSYKMLKQVHELMLPILDGEGIQLLGQGIDGSNRTKLLRRFSDRPTSVLLGTSSFWEGVDIPGDALTVLAIVRLPFQPPNHPLAEAKSEVLLQQKQNPFMKLSIPQAVIRFKQGFGRLVRTNTDKGVVIVYDTRIIDAYYGKHFLYSLPGPKIETMALNQMTRRMREWIGQGIDGVEEAAQHVAKPEE